MNRKFDAAVRECLTEHWEDMVADIEGLVRIPSFKEADKADESAGRPWGPGPAAALEAGLSLARGFGFRTVNLDGRIGYADLEGESRTQIGIIGHMDVVPAGPGWTVPPFELTRKDGYLLGRGVIDDKGPSVVALHAVRFLKEHAADLFGSGELPYSVRFIFGADEECGMGDVPYYRAVQPDPAFLFTPDAEFPVCHGEKGHFDATLVSAKLDGCIASFDGGVASNAVPGLAECVIRASADSVPSTKQVSVEGAGEGLLRLKAVGKSAHASLPEGGVNAIGLIVYHLLEFAPLSDAERSFLELESRLLADTTGASVDCAAQDDDFGALTLVGGVISFGDGCLRQSIDIRYPTSISAKELEGRLVRVATTVDACVKDVSYQEPFLVDASSPEIQALLSAYCEVTGRSAQAFTMGGGTYAREFTHAASFGPEFPHQQNPAWVGGMHGPDEGVSEETLKQAFAIYCLALARLMALEL